MDHGTDCCEILENKVIPLKKGYIAVINRSQRDIAENLEIRKGLAKESAYFQSHSKYRSMLSKCGTRNLANLLNSILIHHIRDVLPEIKTRIARMLANVSANLDNLGYSIDDEPEASKGVVLLNYISQFVNQLNSKVDGRVTTYGDSSNSGGGGLTGGAGLLQGEFRSSVKHYIPA
jgi:replication fork clamp-binding protein CrfC